MPVREHFVNMACPLIVQRTFLWAPRALLEVPKVQFFHLSFVGDPLPFEGSHTLENSPFEDILGLVKAASPNWASCWCGRELRHEAPRRLWATRVSSTSLAPSAAPGTRKRQSLSLTPLPSTTYPTPSLPTPLRRLTKTRLWVNKARGSPSSRMRLHPGGFPRRISKYRQWWLLPTEQSPFCCV